MNEERPTSPRREMFNRLYPYLIGGAIASAIVVHILTEPVFEDLFLNTLYHLVSFGAAIVVFFLLVLILLKLSSFLPKKVSAIFLLTSAAISMFAAAWAKAEIDKALEQRDGKESVVTLGPIPDGNFLEYSCEPNRSTHQQADHSPCIFARDEERLRLSDLASWRRV